MFILLSFSAYGLVQAARSILAATETRLNVLRAECIDPPSYKYGVIGDIRLLFLPLLLLKQ
jgi:hypothetical protein